MAANLTYLWLRYRKTKTAMLSGIPKNLQEADILLFGMQLKMLSCFLKIYFDSIILLFNSSVTIF